MESKGFIGIIITIILYVGLLVTNCLGFYNYLVFLHLEGRIIDIYTRVTAPREYFFIPLDNEVSARYFTWVLTKIKLANKKLERTGGLVGLKKFSITYNKVTESAKDYERKVVHITIYRRNDEGTLVVYRHFVKTDDGTICELEEGEPFAVDEHPLLERWVEVKRKLHAKTSNVNVMVKDLGEEGKDPAGAYNLVMDADSDFEVKEEN
jgi:hypothetical protein